MMKFAITASVLAAAGATAYLIHDHHDAAAARIAKQPAGPTLQYGTGAAHRRALGPTAPAHAMAARSTSVDDLAMLPADADFVGGVDMARIRNGAIWKTLAVPALANAPGSHEFEAECGFDPIASLTSVTIGFKGVDAHKNVSGVFVIHGFAKAKLFACITKLDAKHGNISGLRIDGDVMLTGDDDDPSNRRTALSCIDDTTALLVVGPDATKDGVARIAARRGDAGSPGYSELIHEINTDDAVWFAVNEGSPLLADINVKISNKTAIRVTALYGSIDVTDGMVLNAGARTGSPELVAKLVADIQHRRARVSRRARSAIRATRRQRRWW